MPEHDCEDYMRLVACGGQGRVYNHVFDRTFGGDLDALQRADNDLLACEVCGAVSVRPCALTRAFTHAA